MQDDSRIRMALGIFIIRTLFLFALLFPLSLNAKPQLTIYTYASFVSPFGSGMQIKQHFERQCACTVQWVIAADGVALFNRLQLEGKRSRAEIVLGLDQHLIAQAKASGLFVPHRMPARITTLPIDFQDNYFIPFDYGYLAVIYRRNQVPYPPKSMRELIENHQLGKIIVQDPRISTPGLGFLLWLKIIYQDQAPAAWRSLKSRILTITPSWSQAYALFTQGAAPMVLSYTTSLAYHQLEEQNQAYQVAFFQEGHYLHLEVAGITALGNKNPLAHQFLHFIQSKDFQELIPQKQWMFPVFPLALPSIFQQLKPEKALFLAPETVQKNRKLWIREWLEALS